MLLGVILAAVFMGLALFFTAQNERRKRDAALQNSVPPAPLVAVPETPDATPRATAGAATEYSYTLFVPDDNGDLVRRNRQEKIALPADPTQAREVQARRATETLLKDAPDDFPPGAQLRDVKAKGATIQLDFNDKFTQPDFWQGSTRTLATIYALVNTVAASTPETKSVQFLVEGHPVEVLGEMDAAEPFEPKHDLVVSP
jgi:hypothetical protein